MADLGVDLDLALALELADVADGLTMAAFTGAAVAHVAKADGSPVTEHDRHVEQVLRALLHERRPEDAVLGEEEGRTGPDAAPRTWILDPIDGTSSFIAGGRAWATQLALEGPDGLLVGVTSAPALRRRWWGADGAAFVRGSAGASRPMAVSSATELGAARFVCHLDPGERDGLGGARAEALAAAAGAEAPVTSHGALMVAAGEADVCLVLDGAAWDHAAFAAIVMAAGGRFSALDGSTTLAPGYWPALYSNGLVHDAALAATNSVR